MISIQMSLATDVEKLRNHILDNFARRLNRTVGSQANRTLLEKETQSIIDSAIRNTPEYASLLTGELWHQLGVPDPSNKVTKLIQHWVKFINVIFEPFNIYARGVDGGYTITAIQGDFADVLQMTPVSEFISTNFKGAATTIPWLKWLLLEGDKFIITDYVYIDDPSTMVFSRTGLGLMFHAPINRKGWKVPSQFSGVVDDNWITKAIVGRGRSSGAIGEIRKVFMTILKGA